MDDLNTTDNPEASTPDLAELGARNCSASHLDWNYAPEDVPAHAAQDMDREPCPFCGENSSGLTHVMRQKVLMCTNCNAVGPALFDETGNWNEDDFRAILLWNNRGKRTCRPNVH